MKRVKLCGHKAVEINVATAGEVNQPPRQFFSIKNIREKLRQSEPTSRAKAWSGALR